MLLSLIAILGATPAVTVEPMCLIDPAYVVFHVELKSRWKDESGQEGQASTIYQLKCDRASLTCTGASLRLRVGKDGNPTVAFMDLTAISNAELRSVRGASAVVEWGIHRFKLDTKLGVVSLAATNSTGVAETGVGSCGTITRP